MCADGSVDRRESTAELYCVESRRLVTEAGWVAVRVVASVVALVMALPVAGEQRVPRDVAGGAWRADALGDGAIFGTVRTRTGQRLPDAVVTLERDDGRGQGPSTVTDERGEYSFEGLPDGRYQVVAAKVGFGRRYYGEGRHGEPAMSVEVGRGTASDDVDVVLPRGAVVAGRLRDQAGMPVAGASVFVLRRVLERGSVALRMAGGDRTDDRGVYRVFDLDPGVYYMRAVTGLDAVTTFGDGQWEATDGRGGSVGYAPSFYPGVTSFGQARPVRVRESQELGGVDFALPRVPVATVSGVVTAPAGANPAGADLRLTSSEGPELPGGVLATWAAAGGVFAFERVPPGRYVLAATGRSGGGGAAFARLVVDVDARGLNDLSVVLARGAVVNGRVLFEGAEPGWREIVELRVTTSLLEAGSSPADARTVSSGEDGRFTLRDLAPGPRRFGVAGLGETRVLERITVNGRDITDRTVMLGGGVRVTGVDIVVTDRVSALRGMVRAGREVAGEGAVVVVFATDPERWFPTSRYVRTERPGRDGRYRMRGVPAGDYWVTAAPLSAVGADDWLAPRSLDRLRTGATRVSVRKGDTVDVDVQVRGR